MAVQETMLISKAGILAFEPEIEQMNARSTKHVLQKRAFTFVEVVVALAMVSISLLALIRLQLISINMTDSAEMTSQAVFLAEQQIAETLALGYPAEGANSGTVEKNGLVFGWQTKVTDLRSLRLANADIAGLREVLVDVSWKQGTAHKHLQMSTYVADRQIP